MSENGAQSAAAIRQARILAKSAERLAKITGAAKGENRIISDGTFSPSLLLLAASSGPSFNVAEWVLMEFRLQLL